MKKFLIFLCVMILTAFWTPAFCKLQLTDQGLNLITTSEKSFDNPREIVLYLSGMESEFDQFINQKEGKKQNSKVFGILMNSADSLRNQFLLKVNSYNNIKRYGLNLDTEPDKNGVANHFVGPRLNLLYVEDQGFLGFGFDYKYIQKNYGPHLDSAWNKYIKYNIQENKEREDIRKYDGEDNYYKIYTNLNKKWVKNWTLFTIANPEFPMNEQIKEEIQSMEYSAEKKFDVKSYIISMVGISLAILLLIGIAIFCIIKFNLITKFIEIAKQHTPKIKVLLGYIKTFLIKVCKAIGTFIQKSIKVLLILIGVGIAAGVSIYIYQANALPKCDSKFAEETIIKIFQANDNIYYHNKEKVESISMSDFQPKSYDKGINKYTCRGVLTVHSKPNQTLYYIYPFERMKFDVNYEIYKERGENTARASWEIDFDPKDFKKR